METNKYLQYAALDSDYLKTLDTHIILKQVRSGCETVNFVEEYTSIGKTFKQHSPIEGENFKAENTLTLNCFSNLSIIALIICIIS